MYVACDTNRKVSINIEKITFCDIKVLFYDEIADTFSTIPSLLLITPWIFHSIRSNDTASSHPLNVHDVTSLLCPVSMISLFE